MGSVASSDDVVTVVTTMSRKPGVTLVHFEPKTISERLEDEAERLTREYAITDWLVTTSKNHHGWVSSCVLTRFENGAQIIVAAVASKPRISREQSEYELLGQLFLVGE